MQAQGFQWPIGSRKQADLRARADERDPFGLFARAGGTRGGIQQSLGVANKRVHAGLIGAEADRCRGSLAPSNTQRHAAGARNYDWIAAQRSGAGRFQLGAP